MLPCLPCSAAGYRQDAERCRRLAEGVGDHDAELMRSLARVNDLRVVQAEACERLRAAAPNIGEGIFL